MAWSKFSEMRGVVRHLHNRAREIVNTQDNVQKKVDLLVRVLTQNNYPMNFTH